MSNEQFVNTQETDVESIVENNQENNEEKNRLVSRT